MSRAWEPFRPTYLLTILLQDDVGGLQVLMSDKKWVGIRPVQSSFLNIGDTLELGPILPSLTALLSSWIQKSTLESMSPSLGGDFKKQLLVQNRVVGNSCLRIE
ncbi:hypothetical protein ACFX2J_031722 [Malus domestica]